MNDEQQDWEDACGEPCGLDDISGYSGHEAPEITWENLRGE